MPPLIMIIMLIMMMDNDQVVFPLYYLEVFILGWLLIEFLLRLWSAGIAFIIASVIKIVIFISFSWQVQRYKVQCLVLGNHI